MKQLLKLLQILRSDYDHPWPNEDVLTKKHRLKILRQISKAIQQLK